MTTHENQFNDLTTVFYIKGEPGPDGEFNHPPVGTWTGEPVALEKVVVDARQIVPNVNFACTFVSKLGRHILVFDTEEILLSLIRNSKAEGTITPDMDIATWPEGVDLASTFQIVEGDGFQTFFLCRLVDILPARLLDTTVVYAAEGADVDDVELTAYKHFDNLFTEPDHYNILVTGPYPLRWSE